MFERIYVEIGNICNLNCSFCQGTTKPERQMTTDEFKTVCQKIKAHTRFIYLHVMGEPLLHEGLCDFLKISHEFELPVCITTNGFLLKEKEALLIDNASSIHKISISLHAPEGNDIDNTLPYLESVVSFAKKASEHGIFIVFRLWNRGGEKSSQNAYIESFLKGAFNTKWEPRPKGYRLCKNTFLEYDGVFTWPSQSIAEDVCEGFCHALSSQIAILSDGSVVPCCLDSNGVIELGNIFTRSLPDILSSERAVKMLTGFKSGKFVEPLCKKCTFARKFKTRI